MRQNAKVCSAMQQVKNAMGWNAMKLLRMHQNALICTGMRMGKNYTTFGKKLHLSRGTVWMIVSGQVAVMMRSLRGSVVGSHDRICFWVREGSCARCNRA